jgi:general secretion pathway protein D
MSCSTVRRAVLGVVAAGAILGLAACDRPGTPALAALPPLPPGTGAVATPRINGPVGSTTPPSTPQVSLGRPQPLSLPQAEAPGAGGPPAATGDISLDFADTDIREIVAQVLGTILRVNYTIDPAVRGMATLRTTTPVSRAEVLPALQAVLAENGAALVQSGSLYRVVPATVAGAGTPGLVGATGVGALTGGTVIQLHYASAEDLAKVLQPYVGAGGKVVADAGRNALLVSGEPAGRETLVALIHAFDTDALAGQSYALFPVGSGSAKDFATALQDAFRSQSGGALAGVVRVIPLERVGSVLLVSSQPHYVEEGRRLFGLVEQALRQNTRSWHVYYLQNSRSNDVAYVLQQAFTPNHVTAQPSRRATGAAATPIGNQQSGFNQGGGGLGGGGLGGGLGGGGYNAGTGTISGPTLGGVLNGSGASGTANALGTQVAPGDTAQAGAGAQSAANPLFGGLEPGAPGGAGGTEADLTNTLRIIPDPQNNAILLYATPRETDTVEAMLRKVDILPLQVRIDAIIAEVTLNDNLKYGTQFFFNSGINGALSFGTAANAFASGFPGFVLSGPGGGNAALTALQNVTTVKVLSSPQLLVLDNEAARLQVGNLVPYLSSSSQSTITSGAPIINSVEYRETGVITDVTPRVNSGGLVTLDVSQEVSAVDTSAPTTSGINSPTFLERNVTSRVVVQDGQTIGIAGLITDNTSRGNQGIPFLKDIPLLGLLASQQTNTRARTELLVLITPHVVHDQRDARALTEDLRDGVVNAAAVPAELGHLPPTGSPDPQRPLRRAVGLPQ